ncbi:NAD-dependent succinate-semialdehyde dehydrogenase [Ponticaulis sp.]|uniref:NAD-dependent succinate-semialdehyde dehydrogenase n=1 Tax=Ponticaulis sp. TaxID=2020902 RepID=UPI000B6CA359|nr:NAD-dependent succinate-semialdehyde dehydrogenase [Ponticaulis sp.]MAI91366.1 NADP-dependent succinic semialdehyde dehydrogenase [Ponticaulis sp.]OUX97962.1 MAG: NADP-dependent succinic semialdehyde dehydrogenase [Hyphomonadaceae bacterium TMED5]|tara:strand:+ start:9513 stop:10877 length:1365 start_codon:yes stop_codon:yes gene_type:complete
MIKSINPATGETLKTYEALSPEGLEDKLQASADTFRTFRSRGMMDTRLQALERLAILLRDRKEELGRLITDEMGKPIKQAIAEIEKSASCCDYYAKNAKTILKNEEIQTEHDASYVRWLPIGPVLAVMPWNFPFWQVIRFAAPALAAGNTALLKHASNVPQCAMKLEELFREADFPRHAFQTLLIPSSDVAKVIEDDRVKGVTLTGSEPAGRSVAEIAGKMIKPSVLELGGADPFIIMRSADLKAAVETAVKARTMNTGQSCIAAKRFIVHKAVYLDFLDKFSEAIMALKAGNPAEEDTDIGPLATASIRDELTEQVETSLSEGATLVVRGSVPEGEGNWYPATVLTDIPASAPAAKEEMFGPVASIFRVENIDEAIELANATRFGLGSAAWTQDEDEQKRFIDELDAGFTAINGMTSSDPRLPFGGVKASGYGRELSGLGMRAFLNAKTVTVD